MDNSDIKILAQSIEKLAKAQERHTEAQTQALADLALVHEEGFVNLNKSMGDLVKAIHCLGTAGASTPFGALEIVAKELKDGLTAIHHQLNAIGSNLEKVD